MPRVAVERTAIEVKRLANTPGRHSVGGVAGLILRVDEINGRCRPYWVFRYSPGYQLDADGNLLTDSKGRPKNKRVELGLGAFPEVTLAMARDEARQLRQRVRNGENPVEDRREAKAARQASLRASQRQGVTFSEAVDAYLAREGVKTKDQKALRARLQTYALPHLGKMIAGDITRADVADMLLADDLYQTKTRTAKEVRLAVQRVLAAAYARAGIEKANPASYESVRDLLPRSVKEKTKNFDALPYQHARAFLAKLRAANNIAARAVELVMLTAARSGEVRGATWGEINLQKGEWRISAERMKMDKDHVVYLNDPATKLLYDLGPGAHDELVFPGRVGELTDARLSTVVREIRTEMGLPATVHGLRATFRTWCREETNHLHDAMELSLSHTVGTDVERAYNRAELIQERKAIMADWGEHCAGGKASVTPLKRTS